MYEISFFRDKADPFHFAVTPDATGSVLPASNQWQPWFSQAVYPQAAMEGSELHKLEAAFRHDGYYVYPRKN